MRLIVQVIEARNLLAMDSNGLSDPYAKLQLGKQRSKTKVIKENLNPTWNEEFSFRVGDLNDELTIYVLDEDKYFADDFLGQVKVSLTKVLDADNFSLGTQWYQLHPKGKKLKNKDCGEICLTISLSHKSAEESPKAASVMQPLSDDLASNSDRSGELKTGLPLSNGNKEPSPLPSADETESTKDDRTNGPSLVDRIYQIFAGKNQVEATSSEKDSELSEDLREASTNLEVSEIQIDDAYLNLSFEDLLKTFESKHQETETPESLPGGVVLDQCYAVSPFDLNTLLFSPSSNFLQSLAEVQGSTGLQIEPWRLENDGEILKRVISYTKAATKLVKAVKATEEQTYLKADGKTYCILLSVSTPDVPFGTSFRTEVLFCIIPGPELPSEEKSSRLVISWRTNFLQSTMMKSMIENGTRQGMKENYAQFAELLSQNAKPLDLKDTGSSKEEILASLQTEEESDWKLAVRFFGNFTVVSSVFVAIYVFTHIMLAKPSVVQGLEFPGLDLPDSIGEVVVCGVLVLQGQRVLNMLARFMQARQQRGSDHGIKAQGDGWLLTVALIEGASLAAVDSTGYSDPYVVFTCNGKTKTSSIKFQTLEPQWNEIFEFDAMDDPPSVMDIEVYDFDGPFDDITSLGRAEVNFLKSNLSELADIWIPLQGKLAQACQSKLHLRIFLNNSRGTHEVVKDYLNKMEKEVGKKITVRSPQTNSEFQKIFSLPPEEFLINDFTCHLKRKMLTQGRLFLSPRIVGFYSNLFGHRTKFFLLWDDIEDIQLIAPTLSSMGSPSLLIILRKGRGMDAKHGAKAIDHEGRLRFHFQSFVSYTVAHRTIMALWKARSLSPEQKVQLVEEESETKSLHTEDNGSFLGITEAKMSEVFSSTIPLNMNSLMEVFEGGSLEQRVMEKVGCIDYSVTPWESVKSDVFQRQVHYKFNKHLSSSGGEVTTTQQRSPLPDNRNGWVIEEVMALQGVLLGDYFNMFSHAERELSPVK
ncbi:C2 and GRAM domain-containing protein At1g03370 isoform X2 [Ananas comosus]|uniref:C2 and GRAM domain-containing protein At1g03370 isoform X2 n=1 Tax=Ananas comosus TaxID=4615 RepID=A0A6P5F3C9_ANACO|nr:C2 and GRAM domain-containing protein At1g03370 isoform X2 [Ananas comosus]